MKVLVAGGAGYIGAAVTDAILKRGLPFTVYDNLLYESHYFKEVDFIYGDVRDTEKLKKLLPGYTHLIWLAAIVGDAACQIRPELTVAINQEAVKWLAENYNGRVLFASTCSVYGQHDAEVTEDSPLNPLSLYAQTKVQAERYLQSENGLIFRLGTVFGVSDAYSRLRMDLAVNYMTANAHTKRRLTVFGGDQWRPFIHVKDVGEIMVQNLDRPVRGIYNLATVNQQIKDLARTVSDVTDCQIDYTEQKFQDARNYRVSTAKALRDNVFNPHTARTVQDGVREISALIRNGRIKYTENDMYFNERQIATLLKNGHLI
jgi:nucleoside-diphosphate-sugar epimerase